MAGFALTWSKLSFSVPGESRDSRKQILRDHNGHVTSGTMTAIMGPSGAGKTTLLNCITGKVQDGVEGQVLVSGIDKLKISYVPQFDSLYEQFTTFETLMFASKMKNPSFNEKEHIKTVERVSNLLDLSAQRDVKVKGLSGGQKKRLCIGVEITSRVDLLVLDEPTTGLDSSTSSLLTTNLRDIAISQSIAIAMTIHQPSNEVLNAFDKIYLMSKKGVNVFFDRPCHLISYLVNRGIKCLKTRSLGEIAMNACLDDNIERVQNSISSHITDTSCQKKLYQMQETPSGSILHQTRQLCLRSFQYRVMKTPILIAMVLLTATVWATAGLMVKIPIGKENGCQLSEVTDSLSASQLRDIVIKKAARLNEAAAMQYISFQAMIMLYTFVTAIFFALHVATVRREIQNGWYSVSALFCSILVEGVLEVTLSSAASVAIFVTVSQMLDLELWRLVLYFILATLMTFIAWLIGVMIGFTMQDNFYNVFLATTCIDFPLCVLQSHIIRPDKSPAIFKPLFQMNCFDQAYRGALSVVYGFGRCDQQLTQAKSLLTDMALSQSPYKIISDSIGNSQLDNRTVFRYANILDLDEDILYEVSKKSLDFMEQFAEETANEIQASYILQDFGINNDGLDVIYHYVCLTLMVTVALPLVYLSLRRAFKQ
ncbi:ABC transporter G family member 2 [Halotydeus destructor]|nr:ABC transporter G family member 2 [Halotydeus destructor]